MKSLLLLALALLAGCRSSEASTTERATPPATVSASAPASASVEARAHPAATLVAPPSTAPAAVPCPPGWTCDPDAFQRTPRPKVTMILVQKHAHGLHLVADQTILRSYRVALGSGGYGFKRYEGDRVTPIGSYTITGRYPSRWHTYLALSYPNDEDRRRFDDLVARGEVDRKVGPGSAIAIHGRRRHERDVTHKQTDWTLGCIALDDPEIDEVASLAPVGTRVRIED